MWTTTAFVWFFRIVVIYGKPYPKNKPQLNETLPSTIVQYYAATRTRWHDCIWINVDWCTWGGNPLKISPNALFGAKINIRPCLILGETWYSQVCWWHFKISGTIKLEIFKRSLHVTIKNMFVHDLLLSWVEGRSRSTSRSQGDFQICSYICRFTVV